MTGSDMPTLAGKVAIVTGAGRGIGRAIALGLVGAGAAVVATASRQTTELEALAAEGGEEHILPILADVTKEEDCARVAQAALARFGRIDVLVNNAARGMRTISETFLSQPTRFWEVDPDTWRRLIDTNVNGPFLMARAVVPAMKAAGSGRIVNISVKHDSMRRAGFSPYGPSKAALEAETIIWARDLAGTGITVNALLPGGLTRTGMIPEPVVKALGGQLLDPHIVVAPLIWLVGPEAAEVTGRRFVAVNWRTDLPPQKAASLAADDAGWPLG
jgi:3-oxoacyl-[acyl-carrier protein] reductase